MARYTDGPAVILYHQHDRSLVDAREVQCFVEIALGGCAITTNANRDHRVARDFCGHRQPHGMQHLGSDNNLNGQAVLFSRPVFRREAAKRVCYGWDWHSLDKERCDFAVGGCQPVLWLDRKSTRLNSSHANISYAVFCLKK